VELDVLMEREEATSAFLATLLKNSMAGRISVVNSGGAGFAHHVWATERLIDDPHGG